MSDNTQSLSQKVCVIGAGLAGSEAAYFLAKNGISVELVECKQVCLGPAQKSKNFAELVCTNSLKSMNPHSSHGLLKEEMKAFGSVVLECASHCKVPAGDALAVDREEFSRLITEKLSNHPLINIHHKEAEDPIKLANELGCHFILMATGPLTTEALEKWLFDFQSGTDLYFYDAIAPIVDADSLDYSKLYFKDRHKEVPKNEEDQDSPEVLPDYLNAPLSKEQYEALVQAVVEAEKVPPAKFEKLQFFESCLPIDIMAERGVDTLRFGPLKPIGLELPSGEIPHAVIQLRKENLLGSAYNMVGFQNRLTYKEQVRIFRMIPGMEEAQFIHLGSVHRNTFIHSSKLLNFDLSSKAEPRLHFAGQVTGVEGYTESATCGLYVAYQILRKLKSKEPLEFPTETAIGSIVNYLMTAPKPVPSNVNFGLFPEIQVPKRKGLKRSERKKIKKQLIVERARNSFEGFYEAP
ncbi:MAG: methylenetetrahydrofolate--tRNA-(uracil(54)-C(5))-methyltransferase (FADH(2)-oxidizing) TrmFO [Bacteriovoracaceae bacterium]